MAKSSSFSEPTSELSSSSGLQEEGTMSETLRALGLWEERENEAEGKALGEKKQSESGSGERGEIGGERERG